MTTPRIKWLRGELIELQTGAEAFFRGIQTAYCEPGTRQMDTPVSSPLHLNLLVLFIG